MRHALIPCDGHWHNLPHSPVSSITLGAPVVAEADILEDGTGRVRTLFVDRRTPPLSVEYTLKGEEHNKWNA